jgi:hypothetical protein
MLEDQFQHNHHLYEPFVIDQQDHVNLLILFLNYININEKK